MAEYADFIKLVLPEVIGCPDPMIESAAEEVVRDFCEQTHAWRVWDDYEVEVGEDEYTITPATGADLITIDAVFLSENAPVYADSAEFPGVDDYNEDASDGSPSGFQIIPPSTVRFLSVPQETDTFFVRMILKPTIDAATFPDFLFDKYREGLAAGVKARLMLMRGTRWYEAGMASYYLGIFNRIISLSKINVLKRGTNMSLRVNPQFFC